MLDGVRNNLLRGWPLIIIISVCALPFVFLGTGSLGTVFGSNYGSVNGEQVEEIDIQVAQNRVIQNYRDCLLYTSPSPRDVEESRMPSSA